MRIFLPPSRRNFQRGALPDHPDREKAYGVPANLHAVLVVGSKLLVVEYCKI
eukprot:SAG31_NODE_147_length_22539_cov_37.073663_13_plen_52_part_00